MLSYYEYTVKDSNMSYTFSVLNFTHLSPPFYAVFLVPKKDLENRNINVPEILTE